MSGVKDSELRGRVRRLLEFLRETVGSQSKPIRTYGGNARIEWLYDDSRPLDVNLDVVPGEVAVRIPRRGIEPSPGLPESLGAWVDETATPPVLSDQVSATLQSEFNKWLQGWNAWVIDDRERRPFAELFRSVDLMLHDLDTQPESLELVIASGYLNATFGEQQIAIHLVTQQASITRDDSTGDLLVTLAPASTPRLEDVQVLRELVGFDRSDSLKLQRKLEETVTSALSPAVAPLLREWASSALANPVTIIEDHERPDPAGANSLRTSPALVLRKRGAFALLSYYERMLTALDDGAPLPVGLSQLVETLDDSSRYDWLSSGAGETPSAEPLFPLPANRAQSTIIDKLMNDTGVVVEGPPGTGKTHTIANLMSALMAQGQRVLVTSEKAQALRVLRDKLPVELQDLCVSITDMARGGSAELDASVSTIAARKVAFDAAASARNIKNLAGRRFGAKERRYKLTERIKAARMSESIVHSPTPTYTGTLAAIIDKLDARQSRLGWIPGPLHEEQPPFDASTFAELLRYVSTPGTDASDRSRIGHLLLSVDEVRSLSGLTATSTTVGMLPNLDGVDHSQLQYVSPSAHLLEERARAVEGFGPQYVSLADGLLAGTLGPLWSRVQTVSAMLSVAVNADAAVGSHQVTTEVADRHALNAFDELAKLQENGPSDRMRWLRAPHEEREVAKLEANAKVDGVVVTHGADLRIVTEHIRALVAVHDAANLLRSIGIELPDDAAASREHRVNALHVVWNQVLACGTLAVARDELVAALGAVVPSVPQVTTLPQAAALATEVLGLADQTRARAARAALNAGAERLSALDQTPDITALIAALRSADPDAYASVAAGCTTPEPSGDDGLRFDALMQQLATAAPAFSPNLSENENAEWLALARTFSKAWAWRWTRQWIEQHQRGRDTGNEPEEQLAPVAMAELDTELDALDQEISDLTAQLAAEQAWQACLQRMNMREVNALRAYQENMSNAGLGTSALSQRYRVAARSAMQDAQTAVPAWIMPIRQVLSSIPPEQNAFDVVIVDEASQAEITSMFLMWLAPRVIVVGDDQQCAPASIQSYTLETVVQRLDAYLPDVPSATRMTMTPRSSLFSMLRTRFGNVVRLREHYRSMPEIIRWSSSQFYGDQPLVPVRQFGADRLAPLRSTFVEDAATGGSSTRLTNIPEAHALVDQLVVCLAEPDYEEKTFGVVVLQGAAQADLIRSLIFERVPSEQIGERRIRVGTPPDFQGDERDVMFLSMVIAPGSNSRALTTDMFKRRFNVAATRARDQLWLFHSVRAESLSANDLRRSLLSYVASAPTVPVPAMPENVTPNDRHPDFGSLLEQRIFLGLVDRGYHVNPRVDVNEMAIDLVVTGAAARVAIECDDDSDVDGSELVHRMEREFELRRCGWTFHRVRASDFGLNPEITLGAITEVLDSVGVLPDEVAVSVEGKSETHWTPIALARDEEDAEPDDEAIELLDVEAPAPSHNVDAELAPLPAVIEAPEEVLDDDPVAFQVADDLDASEDLQYDEAAQPAAEVAAEQVPARAMPREDLIAAIRYSLKRNKFSVAQTVEDCEVPAQAVLDAVAEIRSRDAASKVAQDQTSGPAQDSKTRRDLGTTLPPEVAQGDLLRVQLGALPAASWAGAREIAVAAARPDSPLTTERCQRVTGLSQVKAEELLSDLVLLRRLSLRKRAGVEEWVRPELAR
ncbi:AAA domain-containing protein [Rhodococcoides fascians]|uniref:AAA domain-containing protein n=1 Tax=Rhodococcoides fascians TaxID=1828 RepID=UPI00378A68BA